MGRVARAGHRLVVSDYVVDEAITLVKTRSGARVALRILDLIEQSVGIRVERIDAGRFDEAKAFFRRHASQDYSSTDCSSFVVMRELGLRQALTGISARQASKHCSRRLPVVERYLAGSPELPAGPRPFGARQGREGVSGAALSGASSMTEPNCGVGCYNRHQFRRGTTRRLYPVHI